MIANEAGHWFLIERDSYEPNDYYFRVVEVASDYVGHEFWSSVIYAAKIPPHSTVFCGTFTAQPEQINGFLETLRASGIGEVLELRNVSEIINARR